MAAVNGGNVEGARVGEVVAAPTNDGVRIIGYSDLPSRLPMTASNLCANRARGAIARAPRGARAPRALSRNFLANLRHTSRSLRYGRNAAKFILSAGPTTTGAKGRLLLDYDDVAVRGMLTVDKGVEVPPPPAPVAPPAPAPAAPAAAAAELAAPAAEPDPKAPFVDGAMSAAAGACALLVMGALVRDEAGAGLAMAFGLSSYAGAQARERALSLIHISEPTRPY